MNKNSTQSREYLILYLSILFISMVIVLIFVWFLFGQNYLIIRSPYMGYELGYEEVVLKPEILCSPKMKDYKDVELNTVLKSEEYNYDSDTREVTSWDLDYLFIGKYKVNISLKSQEDNTLISVTDTVAPTILNRDDEITVPVKELKQEDMPQYFSIEDYDPECDFGLYLQNLDLNKKGIYPIQFMGYDSSGNIAYRTFHIHVVDKKSENITQKPEAEDPSDNKGYVFKDKEEYQEKEQELKETKQDLIQKEEDLKKELLKEEYESYTEKEEARRDNYRNNNDVNEPEDLSTLTSTTRTKTSSSTTSKTTSKTSSTTSRTTRSTTTTTTTSHARTTTTAKRTEQEEKRTTQHKEVVTKTPTPTKVKTPTPKPACEEKPEAGWYLTQVEAEKAKEKELGVSGGSYIITKIPVTLCGEEKFAYQAHLEEVIPDVSGYIEQIQDAYVYLEDKGARRYINIKCNLQDVYNINTFYSRLDEVCRDSMQEGFDFSIDRKGNILTIIKI